MLVYLLFVKFLKLFANHRRKYKKLLLIMLSRKNPAHKMANYQSQVKEVVKKQTAYKQHFSSKLVPGKSD